MTLLGPVLILAVLGAKPAPGCEETATTQRDLNVCADKRYADADRELNVVYQKLMASKDEAFKGKLREAQRTWIKYRDAHLESMYPDPRGDYGSARPMCASIALTRLTEERTKHLRSLLEPEEGDVCGSAGPRQ